MLNPLENVTQLVREQSCGISQLIGCNVLDQLTRLNVLNGGDDKSWKHSHEKRKQDELVSECEQAFRIFQRATFLIDICVTWVSGNVMIQPQAQGDREGPVSCQSN